jgi:hypothetical protein
MRFLEKRGKKLLAAVPTGSIIGFIPTMTRCLGFAMARTRIRGKKTLFRGPCCAVDGSIVYRELGNEAQRVGTVSPDCLGAASSGSVYVTLPTLRRGAADALALPLERRFQSAVLDAPLPLLIMRAAVFLLLVGAVRCGEWKRAPLVTTSVKSSQVLQHEARSRW